MTARSSYTAANKPYQPHGAARDLFHCREAEILIEGPAGTGKTRAILEKLHLIAEKYHGSRILACRKTRKSMTESVLVTFERDVLPEGHQAAQGASRAMRQAYQYPNGSSIVCGGLDKPERLFSTEYDIVAAFEATELSEDEWEKFFRALRNNVVPYQQAIADCNPGAPSHWLNQRANTGKMARLLSRHSENPTLTPEYLERLAGLTGPRRARLFEGKWAAVEGQVYSEWDAAVHLVNPFAVPADWRRLRVIDFGYTNPFVCQWWAVDGDGRAYLYRELYRTHGLTRDHARRILSLSEGEPVEATIADHDAEERAVLHAEGIPTLAARKSVASGIEAVKALMRVQGDGRPRLYVMRDALVERDPLLVDAKRPVCTEQEIEGYVYHQAADGRPVKEEPVKTDDHGCDGMRYMAMYLNPVTAGKVEFMGEGEPAAFADLPEDATDEDRQAAWLSPENEELWGAV